MYPLWAKPNCSVGRPDYPRWIPSTPSPTRRALSAPPPTPTHTHKRENTGCVACCPSKAQNHSCKGSIWLSSVLRESDTHSLEIFAAIFKRGDNFCNSLFAFQYAKGKRSTLKRNKLFLRSKFFPQRVDPCWQMRQKFLQICIPWKCINRSLFECVIFVVDAAEVFLCLQLPPSVWAITAWRIKNPRKIIT